MPGGGDQTGLRAGAGRMAGLNARMAATLRVITQNIGPAAGPRDVAGSRKLEEVYGTDNPVRV